MHTPSNHLKANLLTALAVLATSGCVAAIQDEQDRDNPDAADAGRAALLPIVMPVPAAHQPLRSRRDFDAGSAPDELVVVDWPRELERRADRWQHAVAQVPFAVGRWMPQPRKFALQFGREVLDQVEMAVHPPLSSLLQYLPVHAGRAHLQELDHLQFTPALTGRVHWDKAKPYGMEEIPGYWSALRKVDPAKLPPHLQGLAGHPLTVTGPDQPDCRANLADLYVLAWLMPYEDVEVPATRAAQLQWTWDHGTRQVVATVQYSKGCKAPKVAGLRSALLAPAAWFEAVTVSETTRQAWLTKVLPELAKLPSWQEEVTRYTAYLTHCTEKAMADEPSCKQLPAAAQWYAYSSYADSASPDAGLAQRAPIELTLLRNGHNLWLKVAVQTDSEVCSDAFGGSHQSLWRIDGSAHQPQRAKLHAGLDGATCDDVDIDGDGQPDVLPVVEAPQESMCPC